MTIYKVRSTAYPPAKSPPQRRKNSKKDIKIRENPKLPILFLTFPPYHPAQSPPENPEKPKTDRTSIGTPCLQQPPIYTFPTHRPIQIYIPSPACTLPPDIKAQTENPDGASHRETLASPMQFRHSPCTVHSLSLHPSHP